MKKIIFFDGDGTLWYPKKTKYKEHPVWLYIDPVTKKTITKSAAKKVVKHQMLIPTVLPTLRKLKKLNIILVVLSTNPYPPKEADAVIKGRVKHFQLGDLFDEVHATREYHGSKGEFMLKILQERGIPKNKALMVGDSYNYDIKSALNVGIDGVLIETKYNKHPATKRIKRKITKMSELLNYV
jgi:phosphoglycolate phosphatase-like HAD superfamily hydrolase